MPVKDIQCTEDIVKNDIPSVREITMEAEDTVQIARPANIVTQPYNSQYTETNLITATSHELHMDEKELAKSLIPPAFRSNVVSVWVPNDQLGILMGVLKEELKAIIPDIELDTTHATMDLEGKVHIYG